jgi:NAD(P)-dependent dehydrogenase (short-subunit alcohol dehydrogenase family)
VLVGRNQRVGQDLVVRLRRQSPDSRFEFVRTDLSQQSEVRSLANTIALLFDRVDVLINNAGARNDWYNETVDGIESTFAANHLGHFLLTHLLLERLVQAPAARVITVGSNAHLYTSAHGEWYMGRANYDRRVAYAKSKLANIMFAYELARRLQHTRVTSNAADPGLVATNFARNNGLEAWLRHLVSHALRRQLISPRKGAETLVYLAASRDVAGITGKYFYCKREVESSPDSRDREEARHLWELSLRLTGIENTLHAAS